MALGTSTPTSMTVVATSTSSLPAAKARITASFSSAGSRPCRTPIRSPCSGPSASSGATSRTASGAAALVVAGGQVLAVGLGVADAGADDVGLVPGRDLLAHAGARPGRETRASPRRARRATRSATGRAAAGCSVEVSRSPKTVIATVRGIGVAVMTSTCGGWSALARRASRCSTPKRCCSSTTMRPRSAKSTPSYSSAWVPTTMPAAPERDLGERRCAWPRRPASRSAARPGSASGRRPARRRGPAGRAGR